VKHLLVYDPILGEEFLENVQMHYDMSSNLEMLIETLQMFVTSYVSSEKKVKWLKQWNQLVVAREATKFPKQGFFNAICTKWFQKVTFWL
jgi:cytochrome b subunit of formate dehydrogenase